MKVRFAFFTGQFRHRCENLGAAFTPPLPNGADSHYPFAHLLRCAPVVQGESKGAWEHPVFTESAY